jgi:alpha-galactosidase
MCNISNVMRQEIAVNVKGINHFTWFDKASYKGMDLFPIYREFAKKYYDKGFFKGRDENWMNSFFTCSNKLKFDLFLKYGLIAAAGDRHLGEFVPWQYLRNAEVARYWGFNLTPVSWRFEDLKKRLKRQERLLSGEEEVVLKPTGEEGHIMIKALLGLGDFISNVNLPNQGQVPNLPTGAVVETNALFRYNSVTPVNAGPLPGNVLSLVSRHVINQENTVRVAMTCDRKLGLIIFMDDPMMVNVLFEDGQKLFNDMLSAQKKYLPSRWWQ